MATSKYKRHVPTDGARRRLVTYVAITAFVLVDVALIAWAVNSTRAVPAAPQAVQAPMVVPTAEPVETTAPEPSATPAVTLTEAATPTRVITALNATTAWRAETGPCPATTASPEYTLNGGVTWSTTDATGPTGVTAIQSIIVEADGIASMVGLAGAGCAPEFIKTFVAGDNYRVYEEQLAATWHLSADDLTITSPSGLVDSPCAEVVGLAHASVTQAAVLCRDQNVYLTESAGVDWSEAIALPNAIGISVADAGYRWASAGGDGCAGIKFGSIAADSATAGTGCLVTPVTADQLAQTTSISEADGALWVWSQDTLERSLDGGATWEP